MTLPPQISAWGEGPESEPIARISQLAATINPEALICAYWIAVGTAPADQLNDATHGSAYVKVNLAAFHTGLRTAPEQACTFTWADLQQFCEDVDSIYGAYIFHGLPAQNNTPLDALAAKLALQSHLVSGSAFPEQTEAEIREIQSPFDDWFAERTGLTPSLVCDVLWAITRCHERNLQNLKVQAAGVAADALANWQAVKDSIGAKLSGSGIRSGRQLGAALHQSIFALQAHSIIPVSFAAVCDDLDDRLSRVQWDQILDIFGADSPIITTCVSPRDLKRRPLLVLSDARVLLTDISNALDVSWAFFDDAARADQKFYNRRYLKGRSKWLEATTRRHLESCFPAACVYSNLVYDDPLVESGTAELDVLVKWGSFVVLCECKSSQFRFEQHPDDLGRLRTDIKANVEDAFGQACRARQYIQSVARPAFRDRSGHIKIEFTTESIDRIYLVTVSQHHMAGFATRLAAVSALGLFGDREYPIAFCIADLELICQYCEGPEVFLHYAEQRLLLLQSGVDFNADDLDLFGVYLDTRLVLHDIDPKLGEYSFISFSGYSGAFDRLFQFRRGELADAPDILLDIPNEIRKILSELRQRDDAGAKYIAFALLGLPKKELAAIAQGFHEIRRAALRPGFMRRLAHTSDRHVILLLKFPEPLTDVMDKHTTMRTAAEKYRLRKPIGIGFGFAAASDRPFDCSCWLESDISYSPELEELVAASPLAMPVDGTARPGRNAPCFCGSGKKFKKCCLPSLP